MHEKIYSIPLQLIDKVPQINFFLNARRLPIGCAAISLLAFLLPLLYEPFWQAKDDSWLDRLINGYGLASDPSSLNLFNNFLWAGLIQLISDFFDISPYT